LNTLYVLPDMPAKNLIGSIHSNENWMARIMIIDI